MATKSGPTEGGSGGKRGHSNMEHWATTEEIKSSARVRRRNDAKKEITKELENRAKAQTDKS